MSDRHIWYSDREASALWLMMFVVATTWPFTGVTAVADEVSELSEVVELKAVEPESWLARAALDMLMLFNLATPSVDA